MENIISSQMMRRYTKLPTSPGKVAQEMYVVVCFLMWHHELLSRLVYWLNQRHAWDSDNCLYARAGLQEKVFHEQGPGL